jgi:predicted 3-demethylubiquinone-9 3-methyltransferase (glyoxalase superfamily)
MQKITTFLWFDHQAEQARDFYLSVFPNSRPGPTARAAAGGPAPAGTVLTVSFFLDGQEFAAINGGPAYQITPAISLVVNCDTQAEVDYYWERLMAGGGKAVQCGWLTDRFGVSWQVVPRALLQMMCDSDAVRVARVTQSMMRMVKLDLAALEQAFRG